MEPKRDSTNPKFQERKKNKINEQALDSLTLDSWASDISTHMWWGPPGKWKPLFVCLSTSNKCILPSQKVGVPFSDLNFLDFLLKWSRRITTNPENICALQTEKNQIKLREKKILHAIDIFLSVPVESLWLQLGSNYIYGTGREIESEWSSKKEREKEE